MLRRIGQLIEILILLACRVGSVSNPDELVACANRRRSDNLEARQKIVIGSAVGSERDALKRIVRRIYVIDCSYTVPNGD